MAMPREWFLVPLNVVDEAIQRIRDRVHPGLSLRLTRRAPSPLFSEKLPSAFSSQLANDQGSYLQFQSHGRLW